ncbi:MAG: hypothetical protein HY819_03660 [Acidobacteria bacterium]|nr:hypothetical protein [Acidobacteriota bacterium]
MLKISQNNHSWIAFEASVLAQQQFESVAIAFAGFSKLDWYLKLWNKRVINNDICQWAWWIARGRVENNSEQLDEFDLEILLSESDEIVEIDNTTLENWFSKSDVIWLENLRKNIDKLNNETRKALAISAGILTGEYLLSFCSQTQDLKRPLSEVYIEMVKMVNKIIDNQSYNRSTNLPVSEFIVRTKADLLYLNLPNPNSMLDFLSSSASWKEIWVRNHNDFYDELLRNVKDSPSGLISSKEHYLHIFSQLLERSKHIPIWAITFLENSPLSLKEMADEVKKHREIKTTYMKDFSEILGQRKTYIIIANQ